MIEKVGLGWQGHQLIDFVKQVIQAETKIKKRQMNKQKSEMSDYQPPYFDNEVFYDGQGTPETKAMLHRHDELINDDSR